MATAMTQADLERAVERVEWRGTKRQREALRQKFGGRCAYCGGDLSGGMHCDHLEPIIRVRAVDCRGRRLPSTEQRVIRPERNVVSNMMPACKACNLHKGGYSLEEWRDIIQRSADIVRKQTSTFRAGERFGVIAVADQPVTFYFERAMLSAAPPQGHGAAIPALAVSADFEPDDGSDDCVEWTFAVPKEHAFGPGLWSIRFDRSLTASEMDDPHRALLSAAQGGGDE